MMGRIHTKKKILIIAEAGVNHNGRVELAKKLIDVAADAKADAVKFQTFQAKHIVSKRAPKANYQKQTTNADESQYDMLKKLELDFDAHKELIQHCHSKRIMFLSSPFSIQSVAFLHKLGIKIIKIPSGEITNLPYLRFIGSLKKTIVMSTGMSDLGEIEDALNVLTDSGTSLHEIILLHCNTEYPTPVNDVNLNAMHTIKLAFPGVRVGYSDHSEGIDIAIAAAAMGAEVIEKHFTLDKKLKGPDHRASLSPSELKKMVHSIRKIEGALGNGIKKPSPSESKNINTVRKSIVAKRKIKERECFSEKNLTTKRPGNGISPMRWDEVVGQKAKKDFKKDELIVC